MDTFQLHVPIKERLLINGYIRSIDCNQTIPYSINMLCIDFYHSIHFLYYLIPAQFFKFNGVYVVDLDNKSSHKPKICHLSQDSAIFYAGACLQKDISVPTEISKCDTNDVIFKCGGSSGMNKADTYCSAIVFDDSYKDAVNWELPHYPEPIECHRIIYSEKYGLLSVGAFAIGKQRSFYQLNMSESEYNDKDNWKWNEMPSTIDRRSWTSLVLTENDKLLAVGGHDVNVGAIGSVEMFDFEQNEWNKDKIKHMKHKRCRNGIVYNEELQRIYICGGGNAEHSAEWYDFEKNKWFDDIPDIRYHIDRYPAMWQQTKNLLFFASASADCLQWIDLRINKKWNTVYGKGKNNKTLSKAFGLPLEVVDGQLSV